MRPTITVLVMAALLSVGATTAIDCQGLLAGLFGKSLIPPLTVSVHVINDAYGPISVEVVSGAAGEETTELGDVAGVTAEAAASQPAGGNTLERGEEYTTTFLCAAAPQSLAVEATLAAEGQPELSATSPTLQYGAQFTCGDRVEFTVRSAAMAGLVVGYSVVEGGAAGDLLPD